MSFTENGITYLTATEASKELGLSRQRFYESVKLMLRAHKITTRKNIYYREDEVMALKNVHHIEDMPIMLQGITGNFEKYMRSLGYEVSVEDLAVPTTIVMDKQIADVFGKSVGSPVIVRKRRQSVQGVHYRLVVNYYPVELADEEILAKMQNDEEADVPALIRNKHHLTIEYVHESVKARFPTREERGLLGIRSNVPVVEIKRTNYASDKRTMIMYNELVLMAGYFQLDYDYPTDRFKAAKSA